MTRNITQFGTLFIAVVALLVAGISLAVNIVLLGALNQARVLARDTLEEAGQRTTALATETINYNLVLNQVVPLQTEIALNQDLPIGVNFTINETIPVDVVVPINQNIQVPIRQEVPIDTVVTIPLELVAGQSQTLNLPIQTTIPLDFVVDVPLNLNVPLRADIPVNFPIQRDIIIQANQAIPIDTQVPLNVDIPLQIPISQTPFGSYLQSIGIGLNNLADSIP